MKKITLFLSKITWSIVTLVFMISMSASGQTPGGDWYLKWSDEFNGNSLNTNHWNVEVGNLNINNELQTYTADRVTVGNGHLTIFASWDFQENRMESGRINSADKIVWDEGYTEARIKFEDWDWNGKDATFAAFWSMGESFGNSNISAHNVNGGSAWPSCGEIDMMEMVPNHDAISTIHYNPSLDYNGDGDSDVQNWPHNWVYHTVSRPAPDWTQWHTFGCEKTDTELKFYIDGVYFGSHYLDETRKEYHQAFFYILNVAIGGDLAGNPPNNYDVYVKMNVDYVRYYKRPWTISLKGSNNKFVSSNNGSSAMMCDRPSVGDWEKFDIIDQGDGKVALKGSNGKYVSSNNGASPMKCDRSSIGGWEVFTWVDLGNSQFALKGSNGKYVSSEGGNTGMMCNRSSIGAWETFNYQTTTHSAKNSAKDKNLLSDDINENLLSDITVFPNPAINTLNINTEEKNYTLSVFDMLGKQVFKASEINGATAINVEKMNTGLYVIKINSENGTHTQLVVVN